MISTQSVSEAAVDALLRVLPTAVPLHATAHSAAQH